MLKFDTTSHISSTITIATCKLRNPSMANWPAYVPVMVLLCPAARTPIAQMYLVRFKLPTAVVED